MSFEGTPTVTAQRAWGSTKLLVAIIAASILLLLLGTGGPVVMRTYAYYYYHGAPADQILVVALFLNLALILLSRRRHHQLKMEIRIRAAAEERASLLASRDPLTGFLNRRALAEEGSAMLAQAQRRHKAMALLLLDLDHFKTVNDMHGHATGDALLRAVADEITTAMPSVALTARLGGDEFACAFLFDASNPEPVDIVARKLVNQLSKPFEIDGIHCHISCSLGISRSDQDGRGMESMMRSADISMYAAKKAGKNRYAWFDQAMENELNARNALESGMRLGIPRGEIVPYFEPQVDLTTGKLLGFEALARWNHPKLGLILPDDFIPIAEETGMIADLSISVIHQACTVARDWSPDLTLSVNISPWQLRDAWLAQKILGILTETGFPSERLEIEITETALFQNLPLAQSVIGSLKNQRVSIALDDFGTGYSSLAHLRALPFDQIKIDRSFVTSINENLDSVAIVNAITKLGESLNLPVTAEGVESDAIAQRLIAMGCVKGQGWHFGKPLSAAEVRRLLAERQLLVGSAALARLQAEAESDAEDELSRVIEVKSSTSRRLAG